MSENMQVCPSCGELVPIEYVVCVWCGYDLTGEHIRRSGITIGKKEAVGRMKKIIRAPAQTFKEINLIPDTKGGNLILYGIGFLMTISMLVLFSKLENLAYNQEGSGIPISIRTFTFSISFKFIVGLVFLIIQPLVLYFVFKMVWKVGTKFLVYLSKSFGGTGQPEKIRAIIGYTLLPVLLAWGLNFFVILFSGKVTVSDVNSYDSIEAAVIQITQEGFGMVGRIFLYIGWVWAAILAIIGISKSAKLSIFETLFVAGIPYILFMLVIL